MKTFILLSPQLALFEGLLVIASVAPAHAQQTKLPPPIIVAPSSPEQENPLLKWEQIPSVERQLMAPPAAALVYCLSKAQASDEAAAKDAFGTCIGLEIRAPKAAFSACHMLVKDAPPSQYFEARRRCLINLGAKDGA